MSDGPRGLERRTLASHSDRRDGRTAEDGNIRVLVLLFGLCKAILFRTYIRLTLYCCYDLTTLFVEC